jgi:transposase
MQAGIRISSLVPSGLVIESVSDSSDSIILAVRSEAGMAECPLCGSRSRRIHSRYDRQVANLPCAGKRIRLRVITRRFVCEEPHCRRRIFAERFGDDVLPTRSRRTARLENIVHHLGLAVGGRLAASFARRLMLPVSNDQIDQPFAEKERITILHGSTAYTAQKMATAPMTRAPRCWTDRYPLIVAFGPQRRLSYVGRANRRHPRRDGRRRFEPCHVA